MTIIYVKIVNETQHPLPSYATIGSSGMDLRAHLQEPYILKPFQRFAVPTGIKIELPDGYEAQVRPRSGLALKQGITCLNSPGTLDSDYRGEIKAILINLSNENQVINNQVIKNGVLVPILILTGSSLKKRSLSGERLLSISYSYGWRGWDDAFLPAN